MIKNDKGITLISLVTTIIVLAILLTVSIQAGDSSLGNVRAGKKIANMTLVKAKVELIYDSYQFENEALVGTECETLPINVSDDEKEILGTKYSVDFDDLVWYSWDKNDLKNQGLDPNMLEDDEYFYVNYEYAEILCSKKMSNCYSYTCLKAIY